MGNYSIQYCLLYQVQCVGLYFSQLTVLQVFMGVTPNSIATGSLVCRCNSDKVISYKSVF